MGGKSRVQIFQRLPKCHTEHMTPQDAGGKGQARWRGEVAAEAGKGGDHWTRTPAVEGRSVDQRPVCKTGNRACGPPGCRVERSQEGLKKLRVSTVKGGTARPCAREMRFEGDGGSI